MLKSHALHYFNTLGSTKARRLYQFWYSRYELWCHWWRFPKYNSVGPCHQSHQSSYRLCQNWYSRRTLVDPGITLLIKFEKIKLLNFLSVKKSNFYFVKNHCVYLFLVFIQIFWIGILNNPDIVNLVLCFEYYILYIMPLSS